MKWNSCKNCTANIDSLQADEECLSELQRKEVYLMRKEQELLKRDKILQRKISKFNKRKQNKAKNDLKAAAKLRHARNKLLLTLDTKEKVKKCDIRTCKKLNKTHAQGSTKQRKKRVENVRETRGPLQYLNNLLTRPCLSAHGKKRIFKEPDSCLRKLFGKPSLCKYQNKNTDRGYNSPGKSGQESRRESYWERAAGDCYLMSMRRPPQLWLYNRWPHFYPQYLDTKQQCKNCKHLLFFVAGILFWTPCLLCLELCKCCFCACCTE